MIMKGTLVAIKNGMDVESSGNGNEYVLPKGVRGYISFRFGDKLSIIFNDSVSSGVLRKVYYVPSKRTLERLPPPFRLELVVPVDNVLVVKKPRKK